jgi:hypothetical protein
MQRALLVQVGDLENALWHKHVPIANRHNRTRLIRGFRIILTNAVKYVSNVDAYDRRIQSAINIQGKKMLRRAEFLLARALRATGWR